MPIRFNTLSLHPRTQNLLETWFTRLYKDGLCITLDKLLANIAPIRRILDKESQEIANFLFQGTAIFDRFGPFLEMIDEQENILFRVLENLLSDEGFRVTSKYSAFSDFVREYKHGKNEVVGIVFSNLPKLDNEFIDVDQLFDFIHDPHTQMLKKRLFSWQNDIETQVENGSLKIQHIPDLISTRLDDYTEWIKKSELKFKYGIYESILQVAAHVVKGLTIIGLPDAVKGLLEFKRREIDLELAEMQAPGRELAYIFHANRKFL